MTTPEVRLRPALPADLPAILAIEHVVFSDPWGAPSFETEFDDPYGWFTVAEDADGRVVGYAMCRFISGEGEVMNIAVDPAWRGRGLGGRLLDAGLVAAVAAGCEAMWLEVRVSNTPARRLYDARGFELVGKRRGYYRHPVEDALVLRRPLEAGSPPAAPAGPGGTH